MGKTNCKIYLIRKQSGAFLMGQGMGWLVCRPRGPVLLRAVQRPTFLWARPKVSVWEALLKSTNH